MTTCDTSVLVPALLAWHPEHPVCRTAVQEGAGVVGAHVLVESHSVLTRLPAPHRVSPADAGRLLGALPARVVGLPDQLLLRLVTTVARSGPKGGAVHDALVAATTRHHDELLLTRDRRARATYDAVGARDALVGG